MKMKIRESCLQTGNLGYKTKLSFTNGDSWVTNGILGLLFTPGAVGRVFLRTVCYNKLSYLY